jgi:predicted negative regulator of RcsB-dependent stress response
MWLLISDTDLKQYIQQFTSALDTIKEMLVTQQSDIDAVTAEITDLKNTVVTANTNIQAELDALKVANPAIDITGLQAAVSGLRDAVAVTTQESTEVPPPAPPA